MRSSALFLASSLAVASLAGCSSSPQGDYQVAVSWLLNGTTPSAEQCREQGVARARFEVWSDNGRKLQTLESNCASVLTLSDGNDYGGFLTTRAFEWDRSYQFELTLVDASGK